MNLSKLIGPETAKYGAKNGMMWEALPEEQILSGNTKPKHVPKITPGWGRLSKAG
jgi:hypothetical protein